MRQVNVHEAKTQLSRLLQEVEDGEEIVIARNGEPVARLVRHEEERKPREPGWAEPGWMAPDFDEFDDELARDFDLLDEPSS